MTLTFEPDLDRLKLNYWPKFSFFRNFYPTRNTHARPSALSGPLKWSVDTDSQLARTERLFTA